MDVVKVLVTGSRMLTPDDINISSMFDIFVQEGKKYRVIHGMCDGVDMMADAEALRRGWEVERNESDRATYGLSAGHISMVEMTKTKPDIVVGILGQKAKGVKRCLKLLLKLHKLDDIYLWDRGVMNTFKSSSELDEYLRKRNYIAAKPRPSGNVIVSAPKKCNERW